MRLQPSLRPAILAFAILGLAAGLLTSTPAIAAESPPAQIEAPSATPVAAMRHRRVWHRRHYVRAPLFCENAFIRRCGPYSCKIYPTRHCWR